MNEVRYREWYQRYPYPGPFYPPPPPGSWPVDYTPPSPPPAWCPPPYPYWLYTSPPTSPDTRCAA